MRRLILVLLLIPSLASAYSGTGGVWAEKTGDFASKNFPGTGAGIQAAVSYCSPGGTVTVWPGTYAFGTAQLTIPTGHVIIQGHGKRDTKFTFSGTGGFIVLGSDDGNHSGAAAYDGTASEVYLRDIWLEGPGKTSNSIAILDWDSGSNAYDNLTISGFGTGYYGIGADVVRFNGVYFSGNGRAVQLGSRCDQNEFHDCYFASNAHGIYNEWAYGMRVIGGQFVFQDSSDITYDVTASPTNGGDIRVGSQRAMVMGTWFEYLSSPPRHFNLGVNGSSSRYLTGLTLSGCEWFGTNTDTLVSIQAFGDVDLYGNGYSGSAATLIRVNPVSGWQPIVHDIMNHMASTITPLVLGGAGADTGAVYRLEPAYSPAGWVFKPKVTIPGSTGTIGFPTTGDRIEFSGSGANLLNATVGQLRLMAANTYRLEANSSGIDVGNGYLNLTGSLGSINHPSAGNEIDFTYGGTNLINATNAAGLLSFRTNNTERMQITAAGAVVTSDSSRSNKGIYVGGQFVNKILRGSATLDFDLTAVTTQDLTFTLTGATVGDEVFLGVPNGSVTTTVMYSAWVSAANTIKVRADALAVGENPASGTFKVTLIQ